MQSLNEHMVIGHVGTMEDVKFTPAGKAVMNLSVATTEKWKDKQSGEMKEKTSWHRVVLWGKSAEFAGEYCGVGDLVMVKAPSYTRKWQDNDGNDRYTTELTCTRYEHFGLLKSKNENRSTTAASKPAATTGGKQEDFDDDIPF